MTTNETMKAVVLEEAGEADKLQFKDVPRPQPGPDQVLVKVKACGVAYRDIIERRGGHPFMQLPIIQGHEFTGDVIEVGSAVKRWQTGDRVLNLYSNSCGACEDCVGADERRCMRASEAYGLFTNGGYAEYAVLHERGLERLHNSLSYEEGACIMPSRARVTAPQESDQTLTVVRIISRMRSTERISPTPSRGKPSAPRMMLMVTSPAMGTPAAPMLASSAVKTTMICCRKLRWIP